MSQAVENGSKLSFLVVRRVWANNRRPRNLAIRRTHELGFVLSEPCSRRWLWLRNPSVALAEGHGKRIAPARHACRLPTSVTVRTRHRSLRVTLNQAIQPHVVGSLYPSHAATSRAKGTQLVCCLTTFLDRVALRPSIIVGLHRSGSIQLDSMALARLCADTANLLDSMKVPIIYCQCDASSPSTAAVRGQSVSSTVEYTVRRRICKHRHGFRYASSATIMCDSQNCCFQLEPHEYGRPPEQL